jgi:ferredoxin
MMGQLIYLKDVVTLRLEQQKCIGCGTCLQVCPRGVLSQTNGKVDIVNRDACMECGACSRNCPVDALRVQAGVGCAAAVINSKLGRKKASCCSIDSNDCSGGQSGGPTCSDRLNCC